MSYCDLVNSLSGQDEKYHTHYHNHLYGFPIEDDNELFGRLILEINQAGLNWLTILKKADSFRKAYSNFDIPTIANYADDDRQRLLSDASIIRNKLKVEAAIHNAQVILGLQKEFGSFKNWLDSQHPKTREEWTKLFRKKFKFTGGEIVNEFLMSSGYLPGAHDETCSVYRQIIKLNPPFLKK